MIEIINFSLTDFGFARYMKKSELLNTNCGSYVYSAPEVLEGAQYEGVQADIWSMGKGSVHFIYMFMINVSYK